MPASTGPTPSPVVSGFASNTVATRGTLQTIALCSLAAVFIICAAEAQDIQALARQSSIVVRGQVLRVNASAEPLLTSSPSTAVISVLEMYAGAEIAGDQRGRTMTVVLSHANSVKVGEVLLFFGAPRFVGRTITLADSAEVSEEAASPALRADLASALREYSNKPLMDRLATASLVLRGTVQDIRPLETTNRPEHKTSPPPSEHDPQWHVATIRGTTTVEGAPAADVVTVLFAASDDIMWFRAPKLKKGQDAVFLLHSVNKEDLMMSRSSTFGALIESRHAYVVTDPQDVQPPADVVRVRELLQLLQNQKEPR